MSSKTICGPFGGDGGNAWDDGTYEGIKQITIHHGDVIDSIQVQYVNVGGYVQPEKHGGSGGPNIDQVELDYPDEFIISFSGYYGAFMDYGFLIQSLTFQTNRKTYGPFGKESGDHQFSVPSTIGKIIGFFGKNGLFLDSIGVYVGPLYISVGPFGSGGGNLWDDGAYEGIKQIIVHFGAVVDSIQVEYVKGGKYIQADKHGGSGGLNTGKVELDYPNEYLTSVSGYYSSFENFGKVIFSLKFKSNLRSFGPFGSDEEGTNFMFPISGVIVGFFGSSDMLLDAIGAHVKNNITNSNLIESTDPFGGLEGKQKASSA